jgi:hypothetical protein
MTLVVSDHDVGGAVAVVERIIQSVWSDYKKFLGLRFSSLADIGLRSDATDRRVWEACQLAGAVLITANRAANEGGLESVIQDSGDENSLPVITLGDQRRILRDRIYAEAAAEKLIDYLDQIESLRGTGRLYIP